MYLSKQGVIIRFYKIALTGGVFIVFSYNNRNFGYNNNIL